MMRTRERYRKIARVSFWITVAVVFVVLLLLPLLFPLAYIITIPVAWNYGKYLKENHKEILNELD
jgi:hypothetical protein